MAVRLGDTRFSLSASRFDTKGFSAIDPALAPLANPDPDGYRNQGLSFSASHKLSPAHEVGVALFSTEAWIDYDQPIFTLPSDQHRSNQELSMLQGWWEARFVEHGSRASPRRRTRTTAPTRSTARFSNSANTRTRQLIWDNEVRVAPPHAFTVGLEGRNQTLDSARPSAAIRCASAT